MCESWANGCRNQVTSKGGNVLLTYGNVLLRLKCFKCESNMKSETIRKAVSVHHIKCGKRGRERGSREMSYC
jgi:hypothetical protein